MHNIYEITLPVSTSQGFLHETLGPLVVGTVVSTEKVGIEHGTDFPIIKFTGPYADLVIVSGRVIRNDETELRESIGRIKLVPKPAVDEVAMAATRVRRYLAEFKKMEGVDHERIAQANHHILRARDLTLLLDALGRDH